MAHYNYIDVLFRRWGSEHFGEETMDRITDSQMEQARIKTMNLTTDYVKGCGRRSEVPDGTLKEFLYLCIEEYL